MIEPRQLGTVERAKLAAALKAHATEPSAVVGLRDRWLGKNWRTNLFATVMFLGSIPEVVRCADEWVRLGHCTNWHAAAGALGLAVIGYLSKDGNNSSTSADVAKADAKIKVDPEKVIEEILKAHEAKQE